MLRLLQNEIPHNFQRAGVEQVSVWLHFVAAKGARSLTEMDGKKQFNNINPMDVMNAFAAASHWIYKKRKWRLKEIHSSINQDTRKLD